MVFFARVVEEKSFTRAALKLGVSKSAVSARIAAVESELKVRLLHRTTRKLSLTADGVAFFEHCARVVAAADQAALAVASSGDEPRGVLRVNAPLAFAESYLAEPIAAYLDQYPGVRLELSLDDKMIDLVQQGVDLAIRISPGLVDGSLMARKLSVDGTILCAAPAYLSRRGAPQAPEDLLQHDCLVYSLLRVHDEWRFRTQRGGQPYTLPIVGRFSAESGALLRSAALAGMGIAALPTFMVTADLESGRLDSLLEPCFDSVTLGVHAVYPQAKRPPSKVRAFVDLLAAYFKKPRWRGAMRRRSALGPS